MLLVDDVPGEAANFGLAFGDRLTAARGPDELDAQLSAGNDWDIAFVDFNLSSRVSTGLSVMLTLRRRATGDADGELQPVRRERPGAVRRRRAALVRRAGGAGQEPQRPVRPAPLRDRHGRRPRSEPDPVADPFAPRAPDRRGAAGPHLGRPLASARSGGGRRHRGGGVAAAQGRLICAASRTGPRTRSNQVNAALFDLPDRGPSRNKKGILGTFVAQHTSFLTAPDLPAALAHRDLAAAAR